MIKLTSILLVSDNQENFGFWNFETEDLDVSTFDEIKWRKNCDK